MGAAQRRVAAGSGGGQSTKTRRHGPVPSRRARWPLNWWCPHRAALPSDRDDRLRLLGLALLACCGNRALEYQAQTAAPLLLLQPESGALIPAAVRGERPGATSLGRSRGAAGGGAGGAAAARAGRG